MSEESLTNLCRLAQSVWPYNSWFTSVLSILTYGKTFPLLGQIFMRTATGIVMQFLPPAQADPVCSLLTGCPIRQLPLAAGACLLPTCALPGSTALFSILQNLLRVQSRFYFRCISPHPLFPLLHDCSRIAQQQGSLKMITAVTHTACVG